jgi:beta-alanine--pyruvate transaminase
MNYGPDTIAACIVEPIAGSTGCLVPPKGYLERLREICDTHGILLIFDEVICGFGRLGAPFAAQAFGVTPDVMTMAKAMTNAAQPMGAVAVSDKVHSTILEAAPEGAVEFFHGYTYSAHPAACAAGLATMDLFEKEDLVARAKALSPYFLDQVYALSDLQIITDIRGYGLFAGIDISPEGGAGVRGLDFQKRLYRNGLHIKMTGDAGLLAPPLIAEPKHIDRMCEILRQTLLEY